MQNKLQKSHWIGFALLALWLAACYVLRFKLMEDSAWVGICDGDATLLSCQVRKSLGLMIHFRVLAWGALALALVSFIIRPAIGNSIAWLALIFSAPALALYTVTPASFALLIAALRLTRESPSQSPSPSLSQSSSQQ